MFRQIAVFKAAFQLWPAFSFSFQLHTTAIVAAGLNTIFTVFRPVHTRDPTVFTMPVVTTESCTMHDWSPDITATAHCDFFKQTRGVIARGHLWTPDSRSCLYGKYTCLSIDN